MSDRILLVIDDPAFRQRLIASLRAAGMQTLLSGDPEQARKIAAVESPAMVVVDGRLPGITGLNWVKQARAAGLRSRMILAAPNDDEVRGCLELAESLGLESVVNRAVPPDLLARHIGEVIAAGAPEPPAPAAPPSDTLAAPIEKLRVSLVALQQNPDRRERIEATLAVAQKVAGVAQGVGAEPVVNALSQIEEILSEALAGRRRIDGAAFGEIGRLFTRAQESAPQFAATAQAAPSAGGSSASHEPGAAELELDGAADASIDPLTTLFSHDAFIKLVDEMISGAMIADRPLSLCVVRLVDEPASATQRDDIMRELGRFFAARFRPTDRRGRWGRTEFAFAFPAQAGPMTVELMKRTLQAAAQIRVATGGQRIAVPLGVGVVAFPKNGRDADSLLAMAEQFANKAGSGVYG